jgi:AraC-like DNA-binding protein
MDYQIYEPSGDLSPFLKCYWSLEDIGDSVHERERVFPDGCIELLFHYGDLFRKFDADGNPEVQARGFVHGQISKFIELEATGKIGIFSCRFQPAGLQPFIDFEVSALTDRTMTFAEIWKTDGINLEKQLQSASDNEQRKTLIEDFLLRRLAATSKNDIMVGDCVNAIIASGGLATIEELSAQFHVGKRQLERRFLAAVGLGQKLFSRIVRFNQALQLIENKDFRSFTNVAHEGGFYDQAHFIKDFKHFTGLNPKQYFSENLEMVKFFNLE